MEDQSTENKQKLAIIQTQELEIRRQELDIQKERNVLEREEIGLKKELIELRKQQDTNQFQNANLAMKFQFEDGEKQRTHEQAITKTKTESIDKQQNKTYILIGFTLILILTFAGTMAYLGKDQLVDNVLKGLGAILTIYGTYWLSTRKTEK